MPTFSEIFKACNGAKVKHHEDADEIRQAFFALLCRNGFKRKTSRKNPTRTLVEWYERSRGSSWTSVWYTANHTFMYAACDGADVPYRVDYPLAELLDAVSHLTSLGLIDRTVVLTAERSAAARLEVRKKAADLERRDREARKEIDRKVNERLEAEGVPIAQRVVDYSAYKTDDDDVPLDNLDEIAHHGHIVFRALRDTFYGGRASRDWKSSVLENPTWLDLCVHANAMMLVTCDHHHCFLEGFNVTREEDGIAYAEFATGS